MQRGGIMAAQNLASLEDEVSRTDKMIQMKVAIEYLTQLIDPKYRTAFLEAEKNARTVEDMTKILDLAKRYIAQRTVIDLLGIDE
jgi:hypothetical protein